MNTGSRNNVWIGVLLIVLGLVLFGGQFFGNVIGGISLLVIGGIFVAAYLGTRLYGLLIPGGILLGLGLGNLISAVTGLIPFLHVDLGTAGLGFGFVLIYLIDKVVRGRTHWWPLIPGGILLVLGLLQGLWSLQRIVIPLIVVLAGAWLLANAMGWTGRRGAAKP